MKKKTGWYIEKQVSDRKEQTDQLMQTGLREVFEV